MKQMIIIIFLWLFSLSASCPGIGYLYIAEAIPIQPYEALISAVVWIESNNNKLAYNKRENAVGAFQIRQCRVIEYNKLTGNNYKLEDFYDYKLSKKMFIFYAQKYDDFETIARKWNGSGSKTVQYWKKVKAKL